MTTQSDYLIKEFNNLIAFSNDFKDRKSIMKKYKYTEEDVLDKSWVRAYAIEKYTLFRSDIDEMGIEVASFDQEIDEMNHLYDDVLFSMG